MRYIIYASLICVSTGFASTLPTQLTLERGRSLELPAKFSDFQWRERNLSKGVLVATDPQDGLKFCFAYGLKSSSLQIKTELLRQVLNVEDVTLTEIQDTQSGIAVPHLPVSITAPGLEQRYIGIWSVRQEVYGTTLFLLVGPESERFYTHVNLMGEIVKNYRQAAFEPQLENEVTTTSVLVSIAVVLLNALVIAVGSRMLIKKGELKFI